MYSLELLSNIFRRIINFFCRFFWLDFAANSKRKQNIGQDKMPSISLGVWQFQTFYECNLNFLGLRKHVLVPSIDSVEFRFFICWFVLNPMKSATHITHHRNKKPKNHSVSGGTFAEITGHESSAVKITNNTTRLCRNDRSRKLSSKNHPLP